MTIIGDYMHKGFTLAEVLVTLGIIGVVSAMTIPTLMRNHQKTVYVNQLKKSYSIISQALDSALTENNAVNLIEAGVIDEDGSEKFLRNYFKAATIFHGDDIDKYLQPNYKNINGDSVRLRNLTGYVDCANLADGSVICMRFKSWMDAGYMFVDINGKEGPNVVGRDFFNMIVNKDTTIHIINDEIDISDYKDDTNCVDYGAFLSKIIHDGWKMDY